MKIQKQVKIGGIEYIVEQVEEISNNQDILGEIYFTKEKIQLKNSLNVNTNYAKEVFLHEILHGVFEHCGMEQKEEEIRPLSIALYMIIKDNPHIFQED